VADVSLVLTMTTALRVVLLGFSEFESDTLASCLRLAGNPVRRFERAQSLAACDFAVIDGGRASAVQQVQDAQWQARTLFIGAKAPDGAGARLARPIDPAHVLRELDGLAARLNAAANGTVEPKALALSPAPASAPAWVAPPTALAAPASPPSPAALAPTAPPTPTPASASPALLRALLVDDSEIAQRFLASRLLRFPFLTERANNSQQALERLARQTFDVVFLDVELGEASHHDGLTLCQLIKRTPTGGGTPIPHVVLVSAHHSELDRVRGSMVGCDAYVAKPLSDAELQAAVLKLGIKPLPTTA
jgi:two-component system, cell cycle response regulator